MPLPYVVIPVVTDQDRSSSSASGAKVVVAVTVLLGVCVDIATIKTKQRETTDGTICQAGPQALALDIRPRGGKAI
jgi:hypothetical protein